MRSPLATEQIELWSPCWLRVFYFPSGQITGGSGEIFDTKALALQIKELFMDCRPFVFPSDVDADGNTLWGMEQIDVWEETKARNQEMGFSDPLATTGCQ